VALRKLGANDLGPAEQASLFMTPGLSAMRKRAALGAHHGEELFFLSESFPSDWDHTSEDEVLGRLIRSYRVQFAKTGNPNFDDAPHWPSFDRKSQEHFELGEHVGVHPVSRRVRSLAHIMQPNCEQVNCGCVKVRSAG
jgi:carboxylesterase type B